MPSTWGDADEQFQLLRVFARSRVRLPSASGAYNQLTLAHAHLEVAGDASCAGNGRHKASSSKAVESALYGHRASPFWLWCWTSTLARA